MEVTNVKQGGEKGEAVKAVGPLKPRRGLFYLMMGLFVGWCLVVFAMWWGTVRPHPELDPHRRAGTNVAEHDVAK